jgi:hypothetical protein
VDPLELHQRLQESDQIVKGWLVDLRVTVHAILDRIDGTALVAGPNEVPLIKLKLGKVKPETVGDATQRSET